jgi:hypothetical protein
MNLLKGILLALLVVLLGAQFIRPEKNLGNDNQANDIARTFHTSAELQSILKVSCYDCHSNTTHYPWYAEIQPIGWWLKGHIEDGKKELNFSEFGAYRPRRQFRKFEEIVEMVKEEEMPLPSYLLAHRDARLSQEQKDRLIQWATDMRDTMSAMYPPDSLTGRKR